MFVIVTIHYRWTSNIPLVIFFFLFAWMLWVAFVLPKRSCFRTQTFLSNSNNVEQDHSTIQKFKNPKDKLWLLRNFFFFCKTKQGVFFFFQFWQLRSLDFKFLLFTKYIKQKGINICVISFVFYYAKTIILYDVFFWLFLRNISSRLFFFPI